VASFRSLFKGIYAETFVLLAHLVQIATKFTKRAFTKNNFKPIWKFENG
jgi:hypothetical protein